jgi:tetratricopeptide (TPR) repeat protein
MIDKAERHVQAAIALEDEGRAWRAEQEYRRALDLNPHHVSALNNLGLLLLNSGRAATAAAYLERAVVTAPNDAISWNNLGAVRREMGEEMEALGAFERALKINPSYSGARLNLANLLRCQGRLADARPHYRFVLERNANDALAVWNLGALEALGGNFDAAFALFCRKHVLQPNVLPPELPRWQGEALDGKRILLDADQGLGDTIMFARFVEQIRARGGRVILWAQRELADILAALPGLDRYVPRDDPMPDADVWFPLVDVPAVLGRGAAQGPWAGSYLRVTPERRAKWLREFPQTDRLRVGLVWQGNTAHPDDRNRSLPLATLFGPLAKIPEVDFISLQVGDAQSQAKSLQAVRSDFEFVSFADTAAVLSVIDLLISVDTSILHLAGALGCPAWGLLPYAPDWRWMLKRRDSLWYQSLVLFRQPYARNWTAVAEEVAEALPAFAAARRWAIDVEWSYRQRAFG